MPCRSKGGGGGGGEDLTEITLMENVLRLIYSLQFLQYHL